MQQCSSVGIFKNLFSQFITWQQKRKKLKQQESLAQATEETLELDLTLASPHKDEPYPLLSTQQVNQKESPQASGNARIIRQI